MSPTTARQNILEDHHLNTTHDIGRIGLSAPPWIAFWLTTLLLGMPGQVHAWKEDVSALFGNMNPPSSAVGWDKIQLQLSVVLDLLPMAIIVTAIVSAASVPIRRRYTERTKNPRNPNSFADIAKYVHQLAPEIAVYDSGNKDTFAYPRSLRRSGIAVGTGTYLLWDGNLDDRNAAKAVLRHEAAHCRQGDALFLKALSPFKFMLQSLPWVILTFGIIPSLVIWVVDSAAFLREVKSTSLDYSLTQFFLFSTPSIFLVITIAIVQIMQAVTMPIAASWSAEFAADHASGVPANQLKVALEKNRSKKGMSFLSLKWITHPSNTLRCWLARRGKPTQLLASTLVYPFAWIIQLLWSVLLVSILYVQNLLPLARRISPNDTDLATLTRWIRYQWENWLDKGLVYWVAALALIAVWPLIGRFWHQFLGHRNVEPGRH